MIMNDLDFDDLVVLDCFYTWAATPVCSGPGNVWRTLCVIALLAFGCEQANLFQAFVECSSP